MTIFTWGNQENNPSLAIQKLEVVPYTKKEQEAIIYAAPGAPQGALAQVPDMLRSLGLTVIPDMKDDQHVLRVRGFGSREAVVAEALEQNGFAPAEARQSQQSEKKKRGNPMDAVKEQSLKAAGLIYFVGDAALMIAGLKRGDHNELRTGAAFTLGSIGLARYGKKKPDRAFDELYDKMLVEFAKEGVEVPDIDRVSSADLGKQGGIIERIENFLYDHPSEIFTGLNAYAGYQFFKAGKNQGDIAKSAAGALIGTGMLVALLVPEKKKDKAADEHSNPAVDGDASQAWAKPEMNEKKGGLLAPVRKLTDWVQEKPLRVGGYMAMANNVAQATSAFTEKKKSAGLVSDLSAQLAGAGDEATRDKLTQELADAEKHQNNWAYNMTAAASYFLANSLLSISSKDSSGGHGGGGKSNADPLGDVAAASAAILAGMPEDAREPMIQRMAYSLSEQKEVSQSADEIAGKMREKIEMAKTSPWLARVAEQQAAQADANLVR